MGSQFRGVASPVTVGRERELSQLRAALDAALGGRPRIVVVGGEAGVGKTRLVTELLGRADADGLHVLSGDCLAVGADMPYLPFVAMLRVLARELPAGRRDAILGPARSELAQIMPELGPPRSREALLARRPSSSEGAAFERLRLFESLLRVAERLAADRPTVVIVEDIQWADAASLALLAFLVHNLHVGRMLLILTLRTTEVAPRAPTLAFLADLQRDPAVARVELAPLDHAAMERLVVAIAGAAVEPYVVERIEALSGGNPFYAEELLASRSQTPGRVVAVSARLRDVMRAHIAHMPGGTLELLRVAAAAGPTLDDRLLGAASGMTTPEVERGLRAAVQDGVLVRVSVAGQDSYRFRHELLREVVADDLLPTERQRVHGAFARALTTDPTDHGDPGEVAYHWDAAGEEANALVAHVEAGIAAERACAFAEASRHFERSLVLWERVPYADDRVGIDRPHLAQRASDAAACAGDFQRAIGLAREVLAAPKAGADEALLLYVQGSLRWYLWESGDREGALVEAAKAVRQQRSGPMSQARATALGHHAGLLLFAGRLGPARREATEALAIARAIGARQEEALALGVLGWCDVLAGRTDAGVEHVRAAMKIAQETGHLTGLALAYGQLSAVLELIGRTEEALALAIEGAAMAAAHGLGRTFGAVLEAAAVRAAYLLGRWDGAQSRVDAALDGGPVGSGRVALLAARALLSVGRGRFDAAEEDIGRAALALQGTADREGVGWLAAAAAELALWRGRPDVAMRTILDPWPAAGHDSMADAAASTPPATTAGATRAAGPTVSVDPSALRDAAAGRLLALASRAATDLVIVGRATGAVPAADPRGSVELAAARLRHRPGIAAAFRVELAVARAEAIRGGASGASGAGGGTTSTGATSAGHAARAWGEAVHAAQGTRPYAEAYARWRLAEALVMARGGRERATVEARAAHALATSLGAAPLAGEVERLAGAARLHLHQGDGPAPEAPGTPAVPFGLTLREREVLVLVAAGLSNREIAERLYISPKTASVHVSNILGKMGVDGRVGAATLAQRLGLTDPP